jgi:HemX protein
MDIDSVLAFHIVISLSAYACFSIGSILSLMYVLLFRKLKNKEFDVYFQNLPSLTVLERFSAVWVLIGVVFMTTASLIGTYWSWSSFPDATMSPREIGIYSVLVLFTLALLSHKFFQFKGVRFAIASLIGFGLLVLTQILQVHGFHN